MEYSGFNQIKRFSQINYATYIWKLAFLLVWASAGDIGLAAAAQTQRFATETRGDFVIFGNTLGQECAAGVPAPIVGTIGACGTNTADSAPDIYWMADSPMDGQASADVSITAAQARSTAVLKLPAGATVLHADLYWAANGDGSGSTATFERPGVFNKSVSPVAGDTVVNNTRYQSHVDVTADVKQFGAGAYRVGGVSPIPALVNVNNSNSFAAWYVVVIYRLDTLPPRNIVLFDGLDGVASGISLNATLSGFRVPVGSSGARLGVVGFDGDDQTTGDSLSVNGTALFDALNPVDNFFNSTRSVLGVAESNAGDLPQLTGTQRSMGGIDIDIVDISAQLAPGDTSMTINAATSGDVFFFGAFVAAIETVRPDFQGLQKTVQNLTTTNGSFNPGDELVYTLTAANTGVDGAVQTVITDVLPTGLNYVAGSLEVVSGDNVGLKSDAADTDQAEFDVATRTVRFRIGAGADGSQGGTIAAGAASTVVRFHARISASASGSLANQAVLACQGAFATSAGNTLVSTFPSGDGTTTGAPTTITIAPGPPQADLELSFTETLVNNNNEASYTAVVTNNGQDSCPSLTLTYPIVADSVIRDLNAGAGWACSQAASLLTCNYTQALATGAGTPSVTFTVTPQAGQTTLAYSAEVQAVGGPGSPIVDPVSDNNTVSGTTTGLIPPPSADVALKFESQLVSSDSQAKYTATVTNNGPSVAGNLIFKALFNADVTISELSAGPGWSCTQNAASLNCTFSQLSPQMSAPAISFLVRSNSEQTSIPFEAQVQPVNAQGQELSDPVPSNNTVTGTTTGLSTIRLSGGGLGCACTMSARDGKTAPPLGICAFFGLVFVLRQRRRQRAQISA